MAQRPESTITEDLDLYRKLRQEGWKKYQIAEEMDFTKARISHFATFWHQHDQGRLAAILVKVIRLHNDLEDASGGEKRRLFTLDKVHRRETGLYSGEGPPRYTVEQQKKALQKTLESVKREYPSWIRPEVVTIEKCEDRELRSLDWHKFMFYLKQLSE